ncbi:MAG TPA: dienelactone hydrolase family protein, partial [Crenalkalicoccus sp.]|nr:dienelactone hydrolase family protein [Crenalkalicoccus sp.]
LVPDLFWRLEPGVELEADEAGRARALALRTRFDEAQGMQDIADAAAALRVRPEHRGKLAAIGYCLGGKLAWLAAADGVADCAIGYYGVGIETALDRAKDVAVPVLLHFGAADPYVPPAARAAIRAGLRGHAGIAIHDYAGAGHAFARIGTAHYDRPAAMLAHSRSIALLRAEMGPHYDLSALWDRHCEHEFVARDVDATMRTMVAEPYVNHIPVMTGGVGQKHLARFYRHHFVHANPADTRLIPVSRTIGADRVVDEMLFCFTHDREINWMLPGIPPTGRKVEIPLVAIIHFRGDRLFNEHIYWNQASVLVQIGVLDPAKVPAVAGVETARKLLDPSLPSNTLMRRWERSAG